MRLKSGSNLTRGKVGRQACVLRVEVVQKTFRLPATRCDSQIDRRSAVGGGGHDLRASTPQACSNSRCWLRSCIPGRGARRRRLPWARLRGFWRDPVH
jgi:hypothetical protein